VLIAVPDGATDLAHSCSRRAASSRRRTVKFSQQEQAGRRGELEMRDRIECRTGILDGQWVLSDSLAQPAGHLSD